jgi:hypothetical protein
MPDPAPDPIMPAKRRSFASESIKAGVYQFIPLPYVDDWLVARQRKEMIRVVLNSRGFTYDPAVPGLLAAGKRTPGDRLISIAKGLVLKPVRKVFRSVFFWISARRAALTVVETYLLGRYLHHPAVAAMDGGQRLTKADASVLFEVFEEVATNIDLRTAKAIVGKISRRFARRPRAQIGTAEVRDVIEANAPGFLARFDQLVSHKLARRREG